MPKINQEEYEFLKTLGSRWKWIARDKSFELWAYLEKPGKNLNNWDVDNIHELVRLNNDLFQFIQWEDENPYNIAELIEEYEEHEFYDYVGWEYYESEETEVKNLEWLKVEIHKELESWYGVEGGIDGDGINEIMLLLNQLDEPEVLSQELPVIPKFVADYINRRKKSGKGLDGAFTYIKAYGWDDESSCDYKVYKWLGIGSNAEIFARAWLDGFTIEEEQKYRVIDSHKVYLLAKEEERNKVETVAKFVEFYGHEHVELNYQLTEQEIKDYDPRYMTFAVKVEELEE